MGKVLKNMFKVIGYMLLTSVLAVFYSLKYVLCGKSIIGRIAILGMYSGLIASLIYFPIVFKIVLVGMALLDLILAISTIKNENMGSDEAGNEKKMYEQYQNNRGYKNPFFDGMSFEEAKKEYRKLMNKYHSDNIDGSLEMTLKIAEAYSNYCTARGR